MYCWQKEAAPLTSHTVAEDTWRLVWGRKGAPASFKTEVLPLTARNAFFSLEDECIVHSRKIDDEPLPPTLILVIVHSQVRYLDCVFCSKDRKDESVFLVHG